MLALVPAINVAEGVEVCSGLRSCNRLRCSEVPADGDLGERWGALFGKARAEIAQRNGWRVYTACEHARVVDPDLIDHRRIDRPGVAYVCVLLAPAIVLLGPENVAAGALLLDAAGIEVADFDALALREVVVDFDEELIRVHHSRRIAGPPVELTSGLIDCIGKRNKLVDDVLRGRIERSRNDVVRERLLCKR